MLGSTVANEEDFDFDEEFDGDADDYDEEDEDLADEDYEDDDESFYENYPHYLDYIFELFSQSVIL